MLELMPEVYLVTLFGLLGGVVLGLAARLSRFCTLGAIEDALYGQDYTLVRMWGVAIGIAIAVVHLAALSGLVILPESVYRSVPFTPLMTIFGGLVFGTGMAFSGNCGFGALSRLGGGDLRSFVIILVMGVTAYAVSSGLFSNITLWLRDVLTLDDTTPGLLDAVSHVVNIDVSLLGIVAGLTIFVFSLSESSFLNRLKYPFWGSAVGLAIASGWIGTHWIAQVGFEGIQPVSHSFTAPIGSTILYVMTSSGNGLSFAIGSVAGVWLGAVMGSLIKGHFRLEACEDPRELQRQIVGAMMMGLGASFAFGCSVGQGLSAMSVLSVNAPLTVISILIGARMGLAYLISGRFLFLNR